MSPDSFDRAIADKVFTNGADAEFVKRKYKATFDAVLRPVTHFHFAEMFGAGDTEWREFVSATLPLCTCLVNIELVKNYNLVSSLEPFATCTALRILDLSLCSQVAGVLEPLRNLVNMEKLFLSGCFGLTGDLVPLSGCAALRVLELEACVGLRGTLEPLWGVPKLEILNVCTTPLEMYAEAFQASHTGDCSVGRPKRARTPLWRACDAGHVGTVTRLLETGSEVNWARDDTGGTSLVQAATKDWLEVCEVLLEHGAAVNMAKKNGTTPLFQAAQKGFHDIALLLISRGATVNQSNDRGATPLTISSQHGHRSVVKLLLGSHASPAAANTDGQNGVFLAARNGFAEVAQALLDARADVDCTDQSGSTPLLEAHKGDHSHVLNVLIAHKADLVHATASARGGRREFVELADSLELRFCP